MQEIQGVEISGGDDSEMQSVLEGKHKSRTSMDVNSYVCP